MLLGLFDMIILLGVEVLTITYSLSCAGKLAVDELKKLSILLHKRDIERSMAAEAELKYLHEDSRGEVDVSEFVAGLTTLTDKFSDEEFNSAVDNFFANIHYVIANSC